MTQQHPITPPPELVQQWFQEWNCDSIEEEDSDIYVATRAAQWGADQELKACIEVITDVKTADKLHAARRPKPPSLKEEALEAFDRIEYAPSEAEDFATILRAIKSIPDDQ